MFLLKECLRLCFQRRLAIFANLMSKKIINIFLVLVLSIQMLPIQQMGKMLFSSQFTEEIPHSMDAKECMGKAEGKSDFISTPTVTLTASIVYISAQRPVVAEPIPLNHTEDIHVPPPNQA
ncbi:hypothetical protein SAMN04488132_103425 [Sediminibacterium ginsengisoli]|uniref:Uncharacterized protein n=2 Tax=Sediminibacterium ginsengisoli TaxID=413434 RepID=A0A1T4MKY5_9BACT|nr:hypothetical protein SAMN04488132_103425 [Sediminibacterium ginsengisoli]